MRTLQERANLLLEAIIGKEELATMLSNESGAILQGGFYALYHSDMHKCVHLGYTDNSLTHRNRPRSMTPSNSFKTPLATIENDENKYLRVYIDWKTKSFDKNEWFLDHNAMLDASSDILISVSKMFDEDSVFEVRSDFEEFGGIATRFYKFGFRLRGGHVKSKFISAHLDLATDNYFWQSLADFIGYRYAVYVPADMLKLDYSNIIDNLPEQISWAEFEARYADPRYGK